MAIIGLNYVLFLILVCDIANTMDQDQIGPLWAFWSRSILFASMMKLKLSTIWVTTRLHLRCILVMAHIASFMVKWVYRAFAYNVHCIYGLLIMAWKRVSRWRVLSLHGWFYNRMNYSIFLLLSNLVLFLKKNLLHGYRLNLIYQLFSDRT